VRKLIAIGILAMLLSDTATAQTLPKVRIGTIVLSGIAPVLVAVDKGYFREEGLDAEIIDFQNAPSISSAVISGDIEFGVSSFNAALFNLAGKGGIKIVAGIGTEQPGYKQYGYFVGSKAYESGLKTIPDLKGRSVALGTFGSAVHYTILAALRKYDIPKESVRLIQTQSIAAQLAAVLGGQADMAILHIGQIPQLEADGSGRTIAWAGDIERYLFSGMYTSPRLIKNKPEIVEKSVRALQKGAAEYNRVFNQRDAAGNFVPGSGYEETLALLKPRIKGNPHEIAKLLGYADPAIQIDVESLGRQIDTWRGLKMVNEGVDANSIVDLSFIKPYANMRR
jgi:NitT/TauT family transport system substrate-binding protein